MNLTLTDGVWRRGKATFHPLTARALHRRKGARLWVPITPETASVLGRGQVGSRMLWPHLHLLGHATLPEGWETVFLPSGPVLNVPAIHPSDLADALVAGDAPDWAVYRVRPRLRGAWSVVNAVARQKVWCWEVVPSAPPRDHRLQRTHLRRSHANHPRP